MKQGRINKVIIPPVGPGLIIISLMISYDNIITFVSLFVIYEGNMHGYKKQS